MIIYILSWQPFNLSLPVWYSLYNAWIEAEKKNRREYFTPDDEVRKVTFSTYYKSYNITQARS